MHSQGSMKRDRISTSLYYRSHKHNTKLFLNALNFYLSQETQHAHAEAFILQLSILISLGACSRLTLFPAVLL